MQNKVNEHEAPNGSAQRATPPADMQLDTASVLESFNKENLSGIDVDMAQASTPEDASNVATDTDLSQLAINPTRADIFGAYRDSDAPTSSSATSSQSTAPPLDRHFLTAAAHTKGPLTPPRLSNSSSESTSVSTSTASPRRGVRQMSEILPEQPNHDSSPDPMRMTITPSITASSRLQLSGQEKRAAKSRSRSVEPSATPAVTQTSLLKMDGTLMDVTVPFGLPDGPAPSRDALANESVDVAEAGQDLSPKSKGKGKDKAGGKSKKGSVRKTTARASKRKEPNFELVIPPSAHSAAAQASSSTAAGISPPSISEELISMPAPSGSAQVPVEPPPLRRTQRAPRPSAKAAEASFDGLTDDDRIQQQRQSQPFEGLDFVVAVNGAQSPRGLDVGPSEGTVLSTFTSQPMPPAILEEQAAPESDLTSLPSTVGLTSPAQPPEHVKRFRNAIEEDSPLTDSPSSASDDGLSSPKKRLRRASRAAAAMVASASSSAGDVFSAPSVKTRPSRTTAAPRAGATRTRTGKARESHASSDTAADTEDAASASATEEDSDSEESDAEDEYEEMSPPKKGRPVKGKGKALSSGLRRVKSRQSDPSDKAPRRSKPSEKTPKSSPEKTKSPSKSQQALSPSKTSPVKSSPLKPGPSSFPLASQSSFRQKDAALSVAPRETEEQRASGWSIGKLDKLVWVRVTADDASWWWPGDIMSVLRSERPLRIQLLVDDEEDILSLAPSSEIHLDAPSHRNLLAFRTGSKLRFDRETFSDGEPGQEARLPSQELFDNILRRAVAIETERSFQSESESDDSPAAKIFKSKKANSKAAVRGKRKAQVESRVNKQATPATSSGSDDPLAEDDLDLVGGGAAAAGGDDDDDDADLLASDDETVGIIFPSVVVARTTAKSDLWWPARLLKYEKDSGVANAKKSAAHNFVVEWTTGKLEAVTRSNILTSVQKEYRTVKLGETRLQLPAHYTASIVEYAATLTDVYQRIILGEYPPAATWNAAYFEGGKARDSLAKRARFGELEQRHLDALQDCITKWASGEGGDRPRGCAQYEQLLEVERSRYQSDVLLPLTVYLIIIHEHDFAAKASKTLIEEGESSPTEDDIALKAFELADAEFDRGSVTKAVHSARSARRR